MTISDLSLDISFTRNETGDIVTAIMFDYLAKNMRQKETRMTATPVVLTSRLKLSLNRQPLRSNHRDPLDYSGILMICRWAGMN